MSKTKKIYFLAAIVMLIGCYALNLSYSIFVQTEEKNAVDSFVPEITYTLSQNQFAIEKNSTKVVKITINNTSNVPFNYGLKASTDSNDYSIKMLKDNLSYGEINALESKDVFLAVSNKENKCIVVNFDLLYDYITVNFDKDTYLKETNIDNINQYDYEIPTSLTDLIINNATNNKNKEYSSLIERQDIINDSVLENKPYLVKDTNDNNIVYYYKGNALDNYIEFNNMCFRIVNFDNSKNVKMILANEGKCISSNENSGYAKLEKDYITVPYSKNNDINYVESDLKDALEVWYKNKFDNNSLIDNYEWCNSKNVLNKNNISMFNTCNGKNVLSNVGNLTKEEIYLSYLNDLSYLKDNAHSSKWFSMSLKDDEYVYTMKDILEETKLTDNLNIRPTIVLKNVYVYGNGTKDNPYIVDNSMETNNSCI